MKGYNTCRHGLELKTACQRRWCNKHYSLQQALRSLMLVSQGPQLPSRTSLSHTHIPLFSTQAHSLTSLNQTARETAKKQTQFPHCCSFSFQKASCRKHITRPPLASCYLENDSNQKPKGLIRRHCANRVFNCFLHIKFRHLMHTTELGFIKWVYVMTLNKY